MSEIVVFKTIYGALSTGELAVVEESRLPKAFKLAFDDCVPSLEYCRTRLGLRRNGLSWPLNIVRDLDERRRTPFGNLVNVVVVLAGAPGRSGLEEE
jgi:hypothetical protein